MMSQEPEDYEGPWPRGDSMTTDEAREFLKFLHGEVPWNGTWFGERAPGERGAYWWRKILDEAIVALAAPHKTDRWNIDEMSDGSLSVCKGEHAGSDPCEPVLYVPATESVLKAPLSMDGQPAAPVQPVPDVPEAFQRGYIAGFDACLQNVPSSRGAGVLAAQAEPADNFLLLDQALSAENVRRVSAFAQANRAEVQRLREALRQISLCSQNSMSSKDEFGRIARRALEGK